ncbi:MAG: pyridoxine 5'-phosphate synthase [Planctomycetota bacterium]
MRLGVNVDHVATVRQARRTDEPDPVSAAMLAELAGADSIVCHLREDRRHIQDRDLKILRETVRTRLNLEMALSEEIIRIAILVHPDQVTLVPERRQEVTTEGGLDVVGKRAEVQDAVRRFREAGIPVSLFIDPDRDQVLASKACGAEIVEIHTGTYANAKGALPRLEAVRRVHEACVTARNAKIMVAAGHGLTYRNVCEVAAIPEIEELNIGHSIVSRAILVGFERAVFEMREIIESAR